MTELERLIRSLGAEEIETREHARVELGRRIREAMPLLRIAADTDSNGQVRHEARHLISLFSAGSVVWTFGCPHGEQNDRRPLRVLSWDKERVYITCGCWKTSLVALDLRSGIPDWEWSPEDGGNESFYLCLENNLILGLFHEAYKPDRLVAIDARLGKTVWLKKGNLSFHNPVVVRGRVFIGGSEGVRVFDLKTGDELWRGSIPAWTTSPLVTDRWVCAPSDDGKIRTYESTDGRPGWEFVTPGGRVSPLCAADGRLFGGCQNRLYALDFGTGRRLWDIETTGWSHGGPHLIEGVLLYKTNYMGPEDKESGGWPTLTKWIGVEPATGALVFEKDDLDLVPSDGHVWHMTETDASALGVRTLLPLDNSKTCAVVSCSGVHRLPARVLTIESEEVRLFAEPDGRLRTGEAWFPPSRRSSDRVLFETLGSFPMFSGRHYDGPRNSRIVCIRAVDIDRE